MLTSVDDVPLLSPVEPSKHPFCLSFRIKHLILRQVSTDIIVPVLKMIKSQSPHEFVEVMLEGSRA